MLMLYRTSRVDANEASAVQGVFCSMRKMKEGKQGMSKKK